VFTDGENSPGAADASGPELVFDVQFWLVPAAVVVLLQLVVVVVTVFPVTHV
jgi:hypothetical protein